jgi:hypothetical protein
MISQEISSKDEEYAETSLQTLNGVLGGERCEELQDWRQY